jgi:hypothetical protein
MDFFIHTKPLIKPTIKQINFDERLLHDCSSLFWLLPYYWLQILIDMQIMSRMAKKATENFVY